VSQGKKIQRQLGVNQAGASKSMEKLSSGLRINRAGDDAAGLAISEKMRGQIRGLKQASRNAQDGISLIQTAEGALNETHAILQRMRELATQASTDTNTPEDRAEIQKEINQLAIEIDRIAETTQFNTMELLDGSYNGKFFHIGANEGQNLTLGIEDMGAEALSVAGEGALADGANPGTLNASATVHGVSDQTTLTDGGVVAVKVGDDWYDQIQVSNKDGVIVADKDAKALTVIAGKVVDGAFVTEGKGEVLGFADQDVLFNADGDIVGVSLDGGTSWNALEGVEANAGGTALQATDPAVSLTVTDGYALGKPTGIDVSSSREKADEAISTIDAAVVKVSGQRSELGAVQNRLEHTIANLGTSAENLQAAEARIRDLDMAEEIMAFTKNNILQQAATAMLAQANMAPQSVLQLLG
jgi:flagellin